MDSQCNFTELVPHQNKENLQVYHIQATNNFNKPQLQQRPWTTVPVTIAAFSNKVGSMEIKEGGVKVSKYTRDHMECTKLNSEISGIIGYEGKALSERPLGRMQGTKNGSLIYSL